MQAFLQRDLGDDFIVESAGISREAAGQPANSYSIKCLALRDMNLRGHTSRWIGELDLGAYTHIVCVGQEEKDAVLYLLNGRGIPVIIANEAGGGVPNPYEQGWNAYQKCAATISRVMPPIADAIASRI